MTDEHTHDAPHAHEHQHGDVTHSHAHTSHEHEHVAHEHPHSHDDGTAHTMSTCTNPVSKRCTATPTAEALAVRPWGSSASGCRARPTAANCARRLHERCVDRKTPGGPVQPARARGACGIGRHTGEDEPDDVAEAPMQPFVAA